MTISRPRFAHLSILLTFTLAAAGILPTVSAYGTQLDTPTLTLIGAGHAKIELLVTAGATGTPAGFTLWWMKQSDYQSNGSQWFPYGSQNQSECRFIGAPTLNNFPGEPGTFLLGPYQSITIQPGDLNGETGIVTYNADELVSGESYVFCVYANAAMGSEQSDYSANVYDTTTDMTSDCTYTIGYWRTHPEDWPVSSLTLGNVSYTAAQLMSILNQPVRGNGLVSLAQQLIATKLSTAQGASASDIAAPVGAADALIGNLVVPPIGSGFLSPSTTRLLTESFDDYNNGITGPGHCGETEACCFADGTCADLARSDCLAQGGTPQGIGTKCEDVTCPQPKGACCYPDYTCEEDVLEANCLQFGGVWYKDLTCADIICVNATDAKSWGQIKGIYR